MCPPLVFFLLFKRSLQNRMSVKGPPFLLFPENLQNRTCLKDPPLDFFSSVGLFSTFFLMSPKGPPFEFFFGYFAATYSAKKTKGSSF